MCGAKVMAAILKFAHSKNRNSAEVTATTERRRNQTQAANSSSGERGSGEPKDVWKIPLTATLLIVLGYLIVTIVYILLLRTFVEI